jgi:hypothetical protein
MVFSEVAGMEEPVYDARYSISLSALDSKSMPILNPDTNLPFPKLPLPHPRNRLQIQTPQHARQDNPRSQSHLPTGSLHAAAHSSRRRHSRPHPLGHCPEQNERRADDHQEGWRELLRGAGVQA